MVRLILPYADTVRYQARTFQTSLLDVGSRGREAMVTPLRSRLSVVKQFYEIRKPEGDAE